MFVDTLRQRLRDLPFRPFVIRMADGRDFYIHHPDFLFIDPPGLTAVVAHQDGGMNLLDIALITELQVAPPITVTAPAQSDNGG